MDEQAQWWTRRAFMHTPERMAQIAIEARKAQNWSTSDLARAANVSPNTVALVESGQPTIINLNDVRAIFTALKIKVLALPATLTGGK